MLSKVISKLKQHLAGDQAKRVDGPLQGLTEVTAPMFQLPQDTKVPAKVLRVLDGDTLQAACEVFPGYYRSFIIRLAKINAPEMRPPASTPGRDEVIARAQTAKEYLSSLVLGKVVMCLFKGREKYGRELAELYLAEPTEPCVNTLLVEKGMAKPYQCGPPEQTGQPH